MHVEEKESVTRGKTHYRDVHVPVGRANVMVSIKMKEKMKGDSHTLTHTEA